MGGCGGGSEPRHGVGPQKWRAKRPGDDRSDEPGGAYTLEVEWTAAGSRGERTGGGGGLDPGGRGGDGRSTGVVTRDAARVIVGCLGGGAWGPKVSRELWTLRVR